MSISGTTGRLRIRVQAQAQAREALCEESFGALYPSFTPRWLHGQLDSSLRSHYMRPVNDNVGKISSSLLSDVHPYSMRLVPNHPSMHDFYWTIICCALRLRCWDNGCTSCKSMDIRAYQVE